MTKTNPLRSSLYVVDETGRYAICEVCGTRRPVRYPHWAVIHKRCRRCALTATQRQVLGRMGGRATMAKRKARLRAIVAGLDPIAAFNRGFKNGYSAGQKAVERRYQWAGRG